MKKILICCCLVAQMGIALAHKLVEPSLSMRNDRYFESMVESIDIYDINRRRGCSSVLFNEDSPVEWKFASKRISKDIYEIKWTATIQRPWHIYSTKSNKDLGFPTKIVLQKNASITLIDSVLEVGDVLEKDEDGFKLRYYIDRVEFVQKVRVNKPGKVFIKGKLEYMPCTESHCLPEMEEQFTVLINNQ